MLAVMLIAGIVALMNSIPLSIRTIYGYSQEFVAITPRGDNQRIAGIIEALAEAPVPIERVMTVRSSSLEVRSIVGPMPYPITGASAKDLDFLLERFGSPRVEGRLPASRMPEAVISEPVARNLGVGLGDVLMGPDKENSYSLQEVKVVGILDTPEWLVLMDREYHELYHFPPINILLAFAENPQQQGELDRWVHERFSGEPARVLAYHLMNQETDRTFAILYQILNVVIGVLVVVITLMMGMLISIYLSQRVTEFGLLQALGYTRKKLLARCLAETGTVLVIGWVLGVAAAFAMLRTVDAVLMHPRAFAINPLDPQAYLYTLPVPAAIFIVAAVTVASRFRKYDPVNILERRLI
jgi:putative ABC transport system permease protein/lipoprotein-releasing system permease protein